MAERAAMNVMGYNYQQKRSFDVLLAAAKNEGGNSMLGAGVGLGAGMGIGGAVAQMAAQINPFLNTPPQPAPASDSSSPSQHSQPSQTITCPVCGSNTSEGAMFCSQCGARLVCEGCGKTLTAGAKFCPYCGKQI